MSDVATRRVTDSLPAWAAGVIPHPDLLSDPETWEAAPSDGWLRRAPEVGEPTCISALELNARARAGALRAQDGFTGDVLTRLAEAARESYDRPRRRVPVARPREWAEPTRIAGGWELDAEVVALPSTIHRAQATPRAARRDDVVELVDVIWDTDVLTVVCPELSSRPLRVPAEIAFLGAAVLAKKLSAPLSTSA